MVYLQDLDSTKHQTIEKLAEFAEIGEEPEKKPRSQIVKGYHRRLPGRKPSGLRTFICGRRPLLRRLCMSLEHNHSNIGVK